MKPSALEENSMNPDDLEENFMKPSALEKNSMNPDDLEENSSEAECVGREFHGSG